MSATPKKKLCWNCEGRVAFVDENCPFCGVYLSPEMTDQQEEPSPSDKNLSVANLRTEIDNRPTKEPSTAYQEESPSSNNISDLLPLVLLLASSLFFVFGIILLAFSKQGVLTLQWDASYWYLYLVLALVLLAAGWRSLQKL